MFYNVAAPPSWPVPNNNHNINDFDYCMRKFVRREALSNIPDLCVKVSFSYRRQMVLLADR